MIGSDTDGANNDSNSGALLTHSNQQRQQSGDSNNVIYHQSNNCNNSSSQPQAAWPNKQLSLSTELLANNTDTSSSIVLEGQAEQNASTRTDTTNSPRSGVNVVGIGSDNNAARTGGNHSSAPNSHRIYINESVQKMGNRQQRYYQINENSNQQQQMVADQSPQRSAQNSIDSRRKSEPSSQLIVDLTTPRVLAKTQTTLLSANQQNGEHSSQVRSGCNDDSDRESWSFNQVGLPQLLNKSDRSFVPGKQQVSTGDVSSRFKVNESSSFNQTLGPNNNNSDISERVAPYYYSDLKSEEQRQALLSIVQQKSLSPPPQLLSRSTDQSSTRLAPKSATMHSSQARMLSENLAQRQQQQQSDGNNGLGCHPQSTSNITRNIDKLFDVNETADNRRTRMTAVQSMLALNDTSSGKDVIDSSHLSSYQTTTESMSSGYCSGDLKSKNFCKSKSLENISQKSSASSETDLVAGGGKGVGALVVDVDKLGNPVYENIRRSDKLMNAINNSTTCLSTSSSRHTRKPAALSLAPPQPLALVKSSSAYNFKEKNHNHSDESMDSILGSSLDDDDDDESLNEDADSSSLDIIDEIKISSTDNHLTDISQLIEQLKSNHSKLSEEYKSTLIRISKTVSSKNKQINDSVKSEKLNKKLQLLEIKSKKCESRSKNQLALIHMMEKVLRQTKARAGSNFASAHSAGSSIDDSVCSSSIELSSSKPSSSAHLDHSSPCLSSLHHHHDYHQTGYRAGKIEPTFSNGSRRTNQDTSNSSSSSSSSHSSNNSGHQHGNDNHSRSTANVIKAIVTEAESPASRLLTASRVAAAADKGGEKEELDNNNKRKSKDQMSLSTRHQQSLQRKAAVTAATGDSTKTFDTHQPKKSSDGGIVSKTITDIERRSSYATFDDDDDEDNNDNDDEHVNNSFNSFSTDNISESQQQQQKSDNLINNSSVGVNGLHGLIRDDEDFIEFLSIEGSNHRSSQFEASQFSASDFSTTTTDSESSRKPLAVTAELDEPPSDEPPSKHLFTTNGYKSNHKTTNTGILKSAKKSIVNSGSRNDIANNNNNNNIVSHHNHRQIPVKYNTNDNEGDDDGDDADEKRNKFNKVLGNVIDVMDVCPMNNMSKCSPVNNRASC